MTFEQLQKANELIQTTDIKGKSYAEVPQRIKAFRLIYPNGSIQTEVLSLQDGVCTIKATILDDDMRVIGVGHAQEKEGSTFINKTSYVENCETSAVGRALGMVGIGIDTSVASYEEVANAMANQKPKSGKGEFNAKQGDAVCPKCGKAAKPHPMQDGRIAPPEEVLERLGCCMECHKTRDE